MRVAKWNDKEVYSETMKEAMANLNICADQIATRAKILCQVGKVVRGKGIIEKEVGFIAYGGKKRERWVEFQAKVQTGRVPGMLRATIRKVLKEGKTNIRVYAGNRQVVWALFVERGTIKMRKHPYLRPAFQSVTPNVARTVKEGA